MDTLNTVQLKKLASLLGIKKIKVISKDDLPSKLSGNYVLNLDESDGRGTHWVALKIIGKDAFYIDSYGIRPPENVVEKVREAGKRGIFINEQIQCLDSKACGWYSLYFLKMLDCMGIHDILSNFSDDCKENERILEYFFSTK